MRERGGDVRLLIEHYLRAISDELGVPVRGIDPDAMRALIDHTWPGNVRELRNVMERAVTLARHDVIEFDDLPFGPRPGQPAELGAERSELGAALPADFPVEGLDLEGLVAELEIEIIERALAHTGGNRTEAARLLGVSFRSLRYRLDKYAIQP